MSNRGNSELLLFLELVGIGAGRSAFSLAQGDDKKSDKPPAPEQVHYIEPIKT